MDETFQKILTLSEVDHAITETEGQLKLYPKMIADLDREKTAAESAFKKASEALDAARAKRREAEKEVEALRQKIENVKRKQMMATSNKEVEAAEHEIGKAEGKIDEWETVGLEQLEAEETLAPQKARAQEHLDALNRDQDSERARIAEQVAAKKERLESLAGERQRAVAALDDDWQEEYDILQQRYPGTVCVPLDKGHCGGCNWKVTAGTAQKVMDTGGIVHCDHCRRILYNPNVTR